MIEDFRLKVFETVARLGSFTAAARDLGVSQPAVSQHINELERQMETKLVSRSRAEIKLTEEGERFRAYAQQILHWYETANAAFGLCEKNGWEPIVLKLGEDKQALVWSFDSDIHISLK